MSKLDEIREESPYWLAKRADCLSPDSEDSPGALMLLSVRDHVVADWEAGAIDDDTVSMIADDAPDVYTHQKWLEFVDLGAYREEPEDGEWHASDLDSIASMALYQIAYRLAADLLRELKEDRDAGEDDDEE
jgi:hypothetical protein